MEARLPFLGWHPVDKLARGGLALRKAAFDDPIGKAVAAKARQPHQIDILGIVAMAQVAHQPPEGSGGNRIIKRVELVWIGIHHGIPFCGPLSCNTPVP